VPFKLNQDRRRHLPHQRHRVTNGPTDETGLRQRGSLTGWFSDAAIGAWPAEPRTPRGGQPGCSALAILTARTLKAVFRLAFRQADGRIGCIMGLLGRTLRVPDHTTLSRRSARLAVPRPSPTRVGADGEAELLHLLVDRTGLKLCGPGEWRVEKHGPRTRRSWRKPPLGLEANTGQIVAASLTAKEVGAWLDQVDAAVAAFTADGGYDQDSVSTAGAERPPEAAIIVPPRTAAVPSDTAETAPRPRHRPLRHIADHDRMAWQKASGDTRRALAEAAIGGWKQVIGDRLRAPTDERRATEVDVAADTLNRMLELGCPNYVRVA
jgi:Transposase DDE domain